MSRVTRFILFLLLNIIISGLVTLFVLQWWENRHPLPTPVAAGPVPTFTPEAAGDAQLESTPRQVLPADQVFVTIDSVIGAGDLENEYVQIKSVTEQTLVLTGWILDDGQGNEFTFPELTLFNGGVVQLHTGPGVNTVTDLYWNRGEAVWSSGSTLTLQDDLGTIRATFKVP
jgi:hypothetical protein